MSEAPAHRWGELAAAFLKLGAIAYGGAMMGLMHAEFVQNRRWLTDERYAHAVAIVSMLPGPPAVQLAIFVGYERAGWRGGVLAGLCFMLPAFFILMGLTLLYAAYGSVPLVQDALHGVGAAVVAIYAATVYRMGRSTLKGAGELAIAVVAGIVVAATPLGMATALLLAACAGIALYASPARGLAAAAAVGALVVTLYLTQPFAAMSSALGGTSTGAAAPSLWALGAFFLKVSALTFGGGIAIIAFVQEDVVMRMGWLTSREFLDGLALGQLTPGPVLMIAAYVGYKLAGLAGALVGAACIFAPAFFLMLPLMPFLERFENVAWIKAAMRGIVPAVIGCLVVTLAQLLPHGVPDAFAAIVAAAVLVAAMVRRMSPLPLVLAAGAAGMLGAQWPF